MEGADRVGGQLRGDKECPFNGVTKSGSVWRKAPESNARSVARSMGHAHTPSIAFRHLPPKEGCRNPVLGVWGTRCHFGRFLSLRITHTPVTYCTGGLV